MKKIIIVSLLSFLLLFSMVQPYSFAYQKKGTIPDKPLNYSQTITIYNPYDGIDFDSINHFKANLHTHTINSDGSSSPAEVIYHYHDIGDYDILSITDHNTNTWSWSKYIVEEPLVSSKSSEYYPDLEMLAISGNEMSSNHHRNSLLNDYAHGGLFLQLAFWFVEQKDGLSFFNHPGRYDYSVDWYQRFYDRFDSIVGIEVYNQGDRYDQDRILWDQINSEREPDDLIWGLSNDDMHHIHGHVFRNYQYFLMNELTESEFKYSLRTGSFYFCYEPNGSDITRSTYGEALTPQLIRVTVNENRIKLRCSDCETIEWIDQESQLIQTGSEIDVSFIDSNFVRAVLTNEYGKTYTQPFGIQNNNSKDKVAQLFFH